VGGGTAPADADDDAGPPDQLVAGQRQQHVTQLRPQLGPQLLVVDRDRGRHGEPVVEIRVDSRPWDLDVHTCDLDLESGRVQNIADGIDAADGVGVAVDELSHL
jgi:hypothetical protein